MHGHKLQLDLPDFLKILKIIQIQNTTAHTPKTRQSSRTSFSYKGVRLNSTVLEKATSPCSHSPRPHCETDLNSTQLESS